MKAAVDVRKRTVHQLRQHMTFSRAAITSPRASVESKRVSESVYRECKAELERRGLKP